MGIASQYPANVKLLGISMWALGGLAPRATPEMQDTILEFAFRALEAHSQEPQVRLNFVVLLAGLCAVQVPSACVRDSQRRIFCSCCV